jgi:hypothetical protein
VGADGDAEGDEAAVGTGAIGSSLGTPIGVELGCGSARAEGESLAVGSADAVAITSLSGDGVNSSAIVGASRKITKVKRKMVANRIRREILRIARLERLRFVVLSIKSINLSMNMSKY